MEEYLRTYCEIDLKAIRQNYINIKKKTRDNAMTMAVIKADGYGHGAVEVAHYLNDIADYFGVATIDEGVELRNAGLKQPILLLGYNSPSLYYKNLEYGVDQTIYCYDTAKAMSEAAVKAGKTARIHIALDTGMTRIGLSPDEKGLAIVKHIAEMPNIKIEGLFTHLSCADTTDKAYTESQMKRYDSFVELLDEAEIEIPVRHICNSAAIMEYDDHRYDMARAGIILYGLYPSDEVDFSNLELTPAMSWYSHVVNIMEPEMGRDCVTGWGADCSGSVHRVLMGVHTDIGDVHLGDDGCGVGRDGNRVWEGRVWTISLGTLRIILMGILGKRFSVIVK